MAPVKKPLHNRSKHFLREWRQSRAMSQEEAAEQAEISRTSLSKIESGIVPYSQDLLERLAVAYECAPADLISRDPNDPDEISLFDLPVGDKERVRNFISALQASHAAPEAPKPAPRQARRKAG